MGTIRKGLGPDAPSGAYPYVVVAMLGIAYMLNFADRQLLSILVEPIKQDLGLSDTQIGLLSGLTFALFYTLFGIPVATLADRGNRIRLVAAACALWSFFTALSGLATGFLSLALARVGVGIGEAGCSPPSHAIIADYFPPARRGQALALYVLGLPAGAFVGSLVGGWIAEVHGWRWAFFALGGVGLLFAPLLLLVVREPVRGRLDPLPAPAGDARASHGTVAEGVGLFLANRLFVLTALGAGLAAFCGNALMAWSPAWMGRAHGLSVQEVGTAFAVTSSVAMLVAAWLGALIADRWGAARPPLIAALPGVAMLGFIPLLLGFAGGETMRSALLMLFPAFVLASIYLVPALALLQNRTPAGNRATVSAVFLFLLNLIGLGGGPLFVGAMSDWLAPASGAEALGHAIALLAPAALASALCYFGAARLLWHQQQGRGRPAAVA